MAEDNPTERICSRCNLSLQEPARLYQQPSPFQQYLGTTFSQNESVSPSDVANAKPYIQALESDIVALDSEIIALRLALLALENQREEAFAHLHLHKCLLCRVHDLPTEILCQIFLYCLDKSDDGGSYDLFARKRSRINGRTVPWDLTAVCRRWREVGTHMPRLWNAPSFVLSDEGKIFFDLYNELEESNCMTTAISRAGQEPLTLDIDLHSPRGDITLDGLVNLFPRVEILYLTGHPVRLSNANESQRCPKLRKLSLTATLSQTDVEQLAPQATLDWNNMLLIVGSSGPLQELTLKVDAINNWFENEVIPLDPSRLPFPLEELTTLTLDCAGRFMTMIPLLRLCPSLFALAISHMDMGQSLPSDDSIIALPSLQWLNLSNVGSASTLSRFWCPRLRHLRAINHSSLSSKALGRMLARSRCALQEFDIEFSESRSSYQTPQSPEKLKRWQKILPLFRRLKIFYLRFGDTDIMARILPLFTQPNAFPLLSSLTVRINGSLDTMIENQNLPPTTPEILKMQEIDAEAILGHFLDTCIHKADGGVLRNLNVHFLESASRMFTNQQGVLLGRRDSRLLAQMRRWKTEGVNVKASQRSTNGVHEDLV
ncbi:hypothetical protein CYLTODRAFT_492033 [Cylindrobasidium torrendii FP15055 ss-10]|uniref:F-box domain-containing protein n=1 Tax=Cylindrobasidium torrendii FP15055 ss-10 TaxID=1314674 RepID=A0A0D7B6J2_9AGAR|nr:hypothetical protein CYLTODRAFT_492033 [Cylindrobasidium torrendii FP15055 ss-10]